MLVVSLRTVLFLLNVSVALALDEALLRRPAFLRNFRRKSPVKQSRGIGIEPA